MCIVVPEELAHMHKDTRVKGYRRTQQSRHICHIIYQAPKISMQQPARHTLKAYIAHGLSERRSIMEEIARHQRMRRRVRSIKGFYSHLLVYIVVNAGLFLINILVQPGNWWFLWSFVGWGIALAIHAVFVFGVGEWLGSDWEEREIQKIAEKETRP
jgi:hypothetical protein